MAIQRPKISILGAGATGATTAHWCAAKELGDIVLFDIVEGMPQGKALDLLEAGPVEGFDVEVRGTNDLADTRGSDLVIITAGQPRKPGMSRADLLSANYRIIRDLVERCLPLSPEAYFFVLTNPVDVLTYVVKKVTGLPRNRVLGQAGVLDSTRYRTFLARALGVSVRDVHALVLGGHGDQMVPLVSYANVNGIPVSALLSREEIERIVERTRKGGGEIVELLKTGSAFYAPGAALAEMADAILKDRKRVLAATTYLEGEYGFSDLCLGVPVVLGGGGIERVIELSLDEADRDALRVSADEVRAQIAELPERL